MARKQRAERWAEHRRQRDEEERQSRVMVITEFDAGDPEATMHAMGRRDPTLPALCETARGCNRVDKHRRAVWFDFSWALLASAAHHHRRGRRTARASQAAVKSSDREQWKSGPRQNHWRISTPHVEFVAVGLTR